MQTMGVCMDREKLVREKGLDVSDRFLCHTTKIRSLAAVATKKENHALFYFPSEYPEYQVFRTLFHLINFYCGAGCHGRIPGRFVCISLLGIVRPREM